MAYMQSNRLVANLGKPLKVQLGKIGVYIPVVVVLKCSLTRPNKRHCCLMTIYRAQMMKQPSNPIEDV